MALLQPPNKDKPKLSPSPIKINKVISQKSISSGVTPLVGRSKDVITLNQRCKIIEKLKELQDKIKDPVVERAATPVVNYADR